MCRGKLVKNMRESELKPLGLPLERTQLRVKKMHGNPTGASRTNSRGDQVCQKERKRAPVEAVYDLTAIPGTLLIHTYEAVGLLKKKKKGQEEDKIYRRTLSEVWGKLGERIFQKSWKQRVTSSW